MSEPRVLYVPCASGNQVMTDCLVVPRGDLIRLLGHPIMDFTATDFARLCLHGLELCRRAGWDDSMEEK